MKLLKLKIPPPVEGEKLNIHQHFSPTDRGINNVFNVNCQSPHPSPGSPPPGWLMTHALYLIKCAMCIYFRKRFLMAYTRGALYTGGGGVIHGGSFVLVINKSDINKLTSYKQENKHVLRPFSTSIVP